MLNNRFSEGPMPFLRCFPLMAVEKIFCLPNYKRFFLDLNYRIHSGTLLFVGAHPKYV